MDSRQTKTPNNQQYWKTAFVLLSLTILILLPFLSRYYGQTGDEWLQLNYGQHIWNYFVHGDPQALGYDNMNSLQYKGQELYGGFFDFGTEILHHALPSIPILILRHFCNAITSALLMIFTGLIAFRLSKKWIVAFIALLFMVFSPRIFGEGMNNPKDIPFAAGFVISVYFSFALLQDLNKNIWRNAIGLALGFGMAFGVRSAGGLLFGAYLVFMIAAYFLFDKSFKENIKQDKKLRNRLGLFMVGALIAGYIIGLLFWPWGLQSPISHPLESLQGMTHRETRISTLFDGRYYPNFLVPWYYEFKWMLISNPIIVIFGILVFGVLIMQAKKTYGWFVVCILFFGALFPLLYMIYKHSSVYDTWRHVFFVYPFWVLLAALGWDLVGSFIKKESLKWIPVSIAIIGLLPTMIWTVKSHPNQYVYFNEFVGGIKGAFGKYEMDYYENTGLQCTNWVLENIKPTPGNKIVIRTNMSPVGINRYIGNDSTWIGSDYGRYRERHATNWDYFFSNARFVPAEQFANGTWPPANVIHAITVDGVPLAVIIQRKSIDGIAASKAYESGHLDTAILLYQKYIQTDSTDENVFLNLGLAYAQTNQPKFAAAALSRAIDINPDLAKSSFNGSGGKFDLLEITSSLYHSYGDEANAQKYHNQSTEMKETLQAENEAAEERLGETTKE